MPSAYALVASVKGGVGKTTIADETVKRRLFPEDEASGLVRMNVLVTEEQKRFLKVRAAITGESASAWLRSAIDAEMARGEGLR